MELDNNNNNKQFSETRIISMKDMFFYKLSILMRTNCVRLLADLFLCSYKGDFISKLLTSKEKRLSVSFSIIFIIIDVLSPNNSKCDDYASIKPDIKETTNTVRSVSFLDLNREIVNKGRLKTKL